MEAEAMRMKIQAKALATARGIDMMSERSRNRMPSHDFGEDYNRLRRLAIEFHPEAEDLFPPAADLHADGELGLVCHTEYHEIMTYSLQIADILDN